MKKSNFIVVSAVIGALSFFVGSSCTAIKSKPLYMPNTELDFFKNLFNHSIDFSKVMFRSIENGCTDDRSCAINNTIFISDWRDCQHNWESCRNVIVHELVHVWQFQHYGRNFIKDNRIELYSYELYDGDFNAYGVEQQAQMFQDYYGWVFEDKPRASFCLDCLDYQQDEVILEIESKLKGVGIFE